MEFLPGAERTAPATGGTYSGGPWRIVLHSTEGSSIEGAIAAYKSAGGVYPHATIDLKRRRISQHIPFSQSAKALKNLPGGVETNRERAIQFELVGQAANDVTHNVEDLKWLGQAVLKPVMAAFGIPAVWPKFYGDDAGFTVASVNAKQRMSQSEWNKFSGICGHQHVPENSHWDPGAFDIATALSGAVAPTTTIEEDPLAGITVEQIAEAVWKHAINNKYGQTYAVQDIVAAIDEHLNRAAADAATAVHKLDEIPNAAADALLAKPVDLRQPDGTTKAMGVRYALQRGSEGTFARQLLDGSLAGLKLDSGTAEERLEKALRVIDAQSQAIQALTSGKADLVKAVQTAVNGVAA